jgi:hypothetical protein
LAVILALCGAERAIFVRHFCFLHMPKVGSMKSAHRT